MVRRRRRRDGLFRAGLAAGMLGRLAGMVFVPPHEAAPLVPTAALAEEPVRDTEAEALVAAKELDQPVEVLALARSTGTCSRRTGR